MFNARHRHRHRHHQLEGRGVDTDSKDSDSLRWLREAAAQGYMAAQCTLGLRYDRGECGLRESQTEAARWFEKAATLGHANAQTCLGDMYLFGDGVEQSTASAAVSDRMHTHTRACAHTHTHTHTAFVRASCREGRGEGAVQARVSSIRRKGRDGICCGMVQKGSRAEPRTSAEQFCSPDRPRLLR